jgi:hypothetical protein
MTELPSKCPVCTEDYQMAAHIHAGDIREHGGHACNDGESEWWYIHA